MIGTRGKRELPLPAGKEALRLARAFVRSELPPSFPEWLSVTALLLSSELVTLAVLHSTEAPAIRVEATDQAVRITVTHACRATSREQCLDEVSPPSTHLVDTLAHQREWRRDQDGTTRVWFVLRREEDGRRRRASYGRNRW